jgi:nucleotide-binding universal stress UspA family protein
MTYKTILVGLNDLDRNEALLASAAQLASRFDAHLQGLYIIPAVEVFTGAAFLGAPLVFEGNRDFFRNAEKSVRAMFDKTAVDAGLRSDLIVVDSTSPDITDDVVEHARRCDITIISQLPTDADHEFIEQILLSTGRPTLVVPRAGRSSLAADLVVIGWSGRREAARAVFDSVPLLKAAKKALVVWVDPEREYPHSGSLPGLDLATTLSRHGVNAAVEPISTGGREAGEALLTKVADSGAELLVMGAYGHSRLSELILGGATRSVLAGMKCPVLFSH